MTVMVLDTRVTHKSRVSTFLLPHCVLLAHFEWITPTQPDLGGVSSPLVATKPKVRGALIQLTVLETLAGILSTLREYLVDMWTGTMKLGMSTDYSSLTSPLCEVAAGLRPRLRVSRPPRKLVRLKPRAGWTPNVAQE